MYVRRVIDPLMDEATRMNRQCAISFFGGRQFRLSSYRWRSSYYSRVFRNVNRNVTLVAALVRLYVGIPYDPNHMV